MKPVILVVLLIVILFLLFEDRIRPPETVSQEALATQIIATFQASAQTPAEVTAVTPGSPTEGAAAEPVTEVAAESSATPTTTPTSTPMPSPTPIPTLTPHLYDSVARPEPYLEQYRLLTYYGVPHSPVLGALGNGEPEQVMSPLLALAREYQALSPDRTVVPAFHIISTVADPEPGPNGYYSHWTSVAVLDQWIEVAGQNELAVILDIQPGRADLFFEVERLRNYLLQPNVHLAIDPEYYMDDTQVPGTHIGSITGAEINAVQEMLDDIALEIGVNKVLVVHQFARGMIRDKDVILNFPHVDLVIDTDGFGVPDTKLHDYRLNAGDPGFEYGGLKLFYVWDSPLLTPQQVMNLVPAPAVVVYQ